MNQRKRSATLTVALFAAVLLFGFIVWARPSSGNHVQPVDVGYNADCADLAPPGANWQELRVTSVEDGTYSNQWVTVTLDVREGNDDDDDDDDGGDGGAVGGPRAPDGDDDGERTTIDWTAGRGVDGVFVKGGPGGYFYHYQPAVTHDSDLSAPRHDGDKYYDPEHILFCTVAQEIGPTVTPGPFIARVYLPAVCKECSVSPGEPNDSCAEAYAIEVNRQYDFLPDNMHDWYRFQLADDREIEVRVENFVPLEGQVAAYRGDSCETAQLLQNYGKPSSQKILDLGLQPAGTFYVYVSNDGVPNSSDTYRLTIEAR